MMANQAGIEIEFEDTDSDTEDESESENETKDDSGLKEGDEGEYIKFLLLVTCDWQF